LFSDNRIWRVFTIICTLLNILRQHRLS
jgi:hypothetical protein